jgi:uncharacterized protein
MKNKLFVLLLSLCIATALTSCGSREDKKEPPKITVTGSAEMEFVPNEIYMNFSLKEYMSAPRKKIKLDTIKAEFLKLCKASGIADSNISISSYTGNENWNYYWYMKRRSDPDFMGSISYTVKVSTPDKLYKIVEGLNEKATDNFYISKTSHSKIEEFRKDVKTKALIAAKTKAEYLAKSIDEEIGEALLIQEVDDSYSGSYYSNEESNYSNKISQTALRSLDDNESLSPTFQKKKLRYEMKVEYRLK